MVKTQQAGDTRPFPCVCGEPTPPRPSPCEGSEEASLKDVPSTTELTQGATTMTSKSTKQTKAVQEFGAALRAVGAVGYETTMPSMADLKAKEAEIVSTTKKAAKAATAKA